VVFRSARLDRDQRSIEPDEIIPFLNDYAQAAIDAVMMPAGEVLKLIGDGVLAMFTQRQHGACQTRIASRRASFSAHMNALNARRSAEGRPVTSAHVGLHVGEVFYGNIGTTTRLDFTVWVRGQRGQPHRVDVPVGGSRMLTSSISQRPRCTGRKYLVSTGRFALRSISARRTSTPRSDIATDEVVAGSYERYLAG